MPINLQLLATRGPKGMKLAKRLDIGLPAYLMGPSIVQLVVRGLVNYDVQVDLV